MEDKFKNIHSEGDTNIGILFYIKNNVTIKHEINNITSGLNTDFRLNQYFHSSPDYQKLVQRIAIQKAKVLKLSIVKEGVYLFESKKLIELENAEIEFKTGALRLAETFLKIEIRTERLKKARDLFEQGLIIEADKTLIEADLLFDQDSLIAQMGYLQNRKVQMFDNLAQINKI